MFMVLFKRQTSIRNNCQFMHLKANSLPVGIAGAGCKTKKQQVDGHARVGSCFLCFCTSSNTVLVRKSTAEEMSYRAT